MYTGGLNRGFWNDHCDLCRNISRRWYTIQLARRMTEDT
jgi:hypothetical protein